MRKMEKENNWSKEDIKRMNKQAKKEIKEEGE